MRETAHFAGTWADPESERVHIVEFIGVVDSAVPGKVFVQGPTLTRCGLPVPNGTPGSQQPPTCEPCLFGELDDVLAAFELPPAGVLVSPERIGAPS